MNLTILPARVGHMLRQLNPFSNRTYVAMPSPDHLEADRRVFMSPLTQASLVFALLKCDSRFLEILPQYEEDHLLVFAICGQQIRCNIYAITQDRTHAPLYNPSWASQGYFHYRMTARGECEHLIRPVKGYYFDSFDPVVSFTRFLTDEEEAYIECMRMH